jgi:hypothetical protein
MTQVEFNFSYPDNTFTEGTMNHALYERLKWGPVRLSELHRILGMDTARIRDVRNLLLKKHGFNIECTRIAEGETEYKITRCAA